MAVFLVEREVTLGDVLDRFSTPSSMSFQESTSSEVAVGLVVEGGTTARGVDERSHFDGFEFVKTTASSFWVVGETVRVLGLGLVLKWVVVVVVEEATM